MATVTLNQVLQLTRKLPGEDQDMLVELVRRNRAEHWRKAVAKDARKSERDFRAGKLKSESAESLVARLRAEWVDQKC